MGGEDEKSTSICLRRSKASQILYAGVKACELPVVGGGNLTQVLCKKKILLNNLSSQGSVGVVGGAGSSVAQGQSGGLELKASSFAYPPPNCLSSEVGTTTPFTSLFISACFFSGTGFLCSHSWN